MTDADIIYLDHNATTPCAPEVVTAMLPFYQRDYGNASSPSLVGRKAARAVATARTSVASLIGCSPEEILFTSGATESNNLVLLGLCSQPGRRPRIVVSAIEHKSVLEPSTWLLTRGFDVATIPVTQNGIVDIDAAAEIIDDRTLLVSLQAANNEIGTLQPVTEVAEIAHARGALVHCDATQLLGKCTTSVNELGVDFASFSAHKVYGPKGVGALFVRNGPARGCISPVYRGGGQEFDIRPGTLNVPGIVGFGEACRLAQAAIAGDTVRLASLRDAFERLVIERNPTGYVIASYARRLPGTSSICFPGAPADAIMLRLPTICIGRGAACDSGAISPSHVILACGYSRDEAACVIRVSIGRYNNFGEIEFASKQLAIQSGELQSGHVTA